VLCRNRAGLAYLANQATVTLHGWAARAPELDRPDRMIFDLDPPGEDFEPVREAARNVVDLMQCLGMNPYLMTTGSRGMHVVAPLRPEADFDQVRTLAQAMAARLVRAHEDTLTDAHRKAQRQGRLYLDVTRNAYGQHAVMPYSVRARPGAPVATPIRLDELNAPDLDARRWNLESVPARLKRQGDPWVNIRRHATTLRHAVDAFEEAVS
jgi:bifunctional non-homologous end joining protein LigD